MKQTKLIEFDYEKYKAGAKAVYRNGKVPQMVILPEKHLKVYPLISINNEGGSLTHTIIGEFNKQTGESLFDLLLEVEEEVEPELFVNVIEEQMCANSLVFKTLQSATESKGHGEATYKLVKVNQ